MRKLERVDRPRCDRQHVHLHLPTRVLVFLQQVQAGFELAIGLFQLFAIDLVFSEQARPIQRTTH